MIWRRGVARINWVVLFLLIVGAVTGVACGGPGSEVATPSSTSLPTEVHTVTPSPSPLPTEAPSPTHKPTPEIAFSREGDLLTIESAGSEVVSVPLQMDHWASEKIVSPSGRILAHSTSDGALWVVNPDGSDKPQILPPDNGVRKIAWSPDETLLAFDRWTGEGEFGHPTYIGLWVVGADGSDPREVYTVEDALGEQTHLLGWSFDGQYLLFRLGLSHSASQWADGLGLYSVPVTGGERRRLGLPLPHDDFLSWSPDGTRLALVDGGGREVFYNKQIVVASPDGCSIANLSDDPNRAETTPSWSPDSQKIVYVSRPVPENYLTFPEALIGTQIWVVNSDGSDKRQLTGAPDYGDHRPLWSSDGQHILFIRAQDDKASFWLMNGDGSDQRPVVQGLACPSNYYGHVDWDTLFLEVLR